MLLMIASTSRINKPKKLIQTCLATHAILKVFIIYWESILVKKWNCGFIMLPLFFYILFFFYFENGLNNSMINAKLLWQYTLFWMLKWNNRKHILYESCFCHHVCLFGVSGWTLNLTHGIVSITDFILPHVALW